MMEEWMKVRHENMQLKKDDGMATSQEVLTAFNSWTELSVSIASVTDGQASLSAAKLGLLQALETYRWAVKGIVELD